MATFDVLILVCSLAQAPCVPENADMIHGTFESTPEQTQPCSDFLADQIRSIVGSEYREFSDGMAVRYLCLRRDPNRRAP